MQKTNKQLDVQVIYFYKRVCVSRNTTARTKNCIINFRFARAPVTSHTGHCSFSDTFHSQNALLAKLSNAKQTPPPQPSLPYSQAYLSTAPTLVFKLQVHG